MHVESRPYCTIAQLARRLEIPFGGSGSSPRAEGAQRVPAGCRTTRHVQCRAAAPDDRPAPPVPLSL